MVISLLKQALEHYLKIFQDLRVETVTVESLLVTEKQVLKNYTESSTLKEINLTSKVLLQLLSTTRTETVEFVLSNMLMVTEDTYFNQKVLT